MFKKILKKSASLLSVIISVALIALSFSSCGKSEGFYASMELDEQPKNLDPQIASDFNDLLIIRNLYEGLMRYDANGNLALGAAKNYTVSNNGLTYTFILRDNIFWSDEETKLTAKDFEFAFKRALASETKAPFGYMLSSVSSFAAKSDNEFIINLKLKNDNFLEVLTYSVCMPCNEDFFIKAKGKYGLDYDHVLSNGSFYLKKWGNDNSFSLKISAFGKYYGAFLPKAQSVGFTVQNEESKETRIAKNYIDFGFVNNPTKEYKSKNLQYTEFFNTDYCLIINPKNKSLSSTNIKIAIEQSVHRNLIKNNMPANYLPTFSVIPNIITESSADIKDTVSKVSALNYNPDEAIKNFRSIQTKKSKTDISGTTIIYKKDDNIKTLASTLAETWQQTISGYVNIEEFETDAEISAKMGISDFDFAIIPFSADTQDIYIYLEKFLSLDLGDYTQSFRSAVAGIKQSTSRTDYLNQTLNALNILKNSHICIPLVQSSATFVSSENYILPKILPKNGYIDFALIAEK